MYNLKMMCNGETREMETDNLKEGILSLKPDVLYTEMYIVISKEDILRERRLSLKQGKRLFIDESYLDIFIINLFL